VCVHRAPRRSERRGRHRHAAQLTAPSFTACAPRSGGKKKRHSERTTQWFLTRILPFRHRRVLCVFEFILASRVKHPSWCHVALVKQQQQQQDSENWKSRIRLSSPPPFVRETTRVVTQNSTGLFVTNIRCTCLFGYYHGLYLSGTHSTEFYFIKPTPSHCSFCVSTNQMSIYRHLVKPPERWGVDRWIAISIDILFPANLPRKSKNNTHLRRSARYYECKARHQ